MAIAITKRDGTRTVVKTVRELVEKAGPKFNFCLAAKTAFVFIGTADEFKRDAGLLDQTYGVLSAKKVPLMDRKIIGCRKRDVPGEARHMILIEGSETGLFWLRCEYKAFRERCGSAQGQ